MCMFNCLNLSDKIPKRVFLPQKTRQVYCKGCLPALTSFMRFIWLNTPVPLRRALFWNTGSLALEGKAQMAEPSAESLHTLPWEVSSVPNTFSSGAVVLWVSWRWWLAWPEVCFISPETAVIFTSSPSPLLVLTLWGQRRYQKAIKAALRQSRALLACALLSVPPVVPHCCDVKAAIQGREKGNRGLSSHQ